MERKAREVLQMLRQVLSDLNVIEGEWENFPSAELKKILAANSGFGTLYFTREGKLYGYLSLRNIPKDGAQLPVQKAEIMVQGWDYSRAKELFASKKELDTLPVVDGRGMLLGDYVRSSLPEFVEIHKSYLKWMGESSYQGKTFLAVLPHCEAKRRALEKILACFSSIRIPFEICEWEKAKEADRSFVALLADWVEGFCKDYVFGNPIAGMRIVSYRNLLGHLRVMHRKHAFANSLAGLKLYTFNFDFGQKAIADTDYVKNYKKVMQERKKMCDPKVTGGLLVPPELKERFFDELYTPAYWKIFNTKLSRQHKINGITWLDDMKTKWVNIENGSRRVLYWGGGTPSQRCWFFGSCVFVGSRVEDKNTIESMVQKQIRQAGLKCRVMNRSAWEDAAGRIWKIVNTVFHHGDVVVIHEIGSLPGAEEINPAGIAYERNMPLDWFTDQMPHANHHAISIWAQSVFEKIQKDIIVPPVYRRGDFAKREVYSRVLYRHIPAPRRVG